MLLLYQSAVLESKANPTVLSGVRSRGAVRRELNPHPLGSEPSAGPFSFARVWAMIRPGRLTVYSHFVQAGLGEVPIEAEEMVDGLAHTGVVI